MKKNMGAADRAVRMAVALSIIILYVTGVMTGLLAIVLSIVAYFFIITSIISFCPAYHALGWSTAGHEHA